MKRVVLIVLAALLLCGAVACGSALERTKDGTLRIVTTIFPIRDWTVNVLGDRADAADVRLLVDNGVDLHSFQPTVADVAAIADCDLFVYIGGESDRWVSDALEKMPNPDRVALNLMDALGKAAREEESVEGMQTEEEPEDAALDEHIWLSLQNAETLCAAIRDALITLDPAHAASYRAGCAAYSEQLAALDAAYRRTVESAPVRTLLFADRFPFRYLTEDYGLSYYAAFSGCSAETEASFETIAFLAKKADELGLKAILKIETSDGRIAETVAQNTAARDQKILTLDSMQSVTAADMENGETYLAVMERNLAVLGEALQQEDTWHI